jgi:sulfotransferase 6B1
MRIVANSVPKSGTHLLARLLTLLGFEKTDFGGIRSHLVTGPYAPVKRLLRARGEEKVTVGVVLPEQVGRRWLKRRLGGVSDGQFVTAHCVHTPELAGLLREEGMRAVCILRDPRDVAVSQMHYIKRLKAHPVHDAFVGLPTDGERLMFSIRGGELGGREMLSLEERYRRFSGWASEEGAVVVRFEDLVGPEGGGSAEAQRMAVERVAAHLGVEADGATLARVGEGIFGAGQTFRKGMIGGWREEFSAEHDRAAEEVAGRLLEELGYEAAPHR